MKHRKILAVLVVLVMCLLAACADGSRASSNHEQNELTTNSMAQPSTTTTTAPNPTSTTTTRPIPTTAATEPTQDEEPPIEDEPVETPQLSESCHKIMASGYDADGNYYELVANEHEDYSGTKIEMGIIKNNEWAIPMTSDCPFVDDNGLLRSAGGNFRGSIYEDNFAVFYYIGAGCFYYRYNIWNGNTGASYICGDNEGYMPVVTGKNPCINNEGQFILSNYGKNYKLLDANAMTMTEMDLEEDGWDIDYCFPYSEGLFACMNKSHDAESNGFYDKNGNKIIDLSQYRLARITYEYDGTGNSGPAQDLVFENGTCTFKIYNDQGSVYLITIDKTGKVIDSERATLY